MDCRQIVKLLVAALVLEASKMRGTTARQVTMLAVIDADQLTPADHPIRRVKPIVEAALKEFESIFVTMYSEVGQRSIPPEHLLKACLLMAFYSIRSERQFCERLQSDLLFKWFLDLNVEDEAFDHSSFAKNRERLLEHEISRAFFAAVLAQARQRHLLSSLYVANAVVLGCLWLRRWRSSTSAKARPRPRVPSDKSEVE